MRSIGTGSNLRGADHGGCRWIAPGEVDRVDVGRPTYGEGVDRIESIVQRLERLESIDAIRDLVARYCWGADHRDVAAWDSVWAPGAVWKVGPARSFVGGDEIRGAVERQWAAFPQMLHATANHRVEIDGDRASGVADVTVMTRLGEDFGQHAGCWVSGGGLYRDEYVRTEGTWYLGKREVTGDFLHGPAPAFEPTRSRT